MKITANSINESARQSVDSHLPDRFEVINRKSDGFIDHAGDSDGHRRRTYNYTAVDTTGRVGGDAKSKVQSPSGSRGNFDLARTSQGA